MRSDAPIGLDNVPNVQFGAMYVNSSGVIIESINEENDDFRLVVKMSDAQSVGVSNAWSRTVVVTSSEETDWGELDLTDAFADVLGTEVEDGKKYFVEIYWIDSVTGFAGPVIQFDGIAAVIPALIELARRHLHPKAAVLVNVLRAWNRRLNTRRQ